jgi:hypothetical protein
LLVITNLHRSSLLTSFVSRQSLSDVALPRVCNSSVQHTPVVELLFTILYRSQQYFVCPFLISTHLAVHVCRSAAKTPITDPIRGTCCRTFSPEVTHFLFTEQSPVTRCYCAFIRDVCSFHIACVFSNNVVSDTVLCPYERMRIFFHDLFALLTIVALLTIFRAFVFIMSSPLGFDLYVVVLRHPLGLSLAHLLLLLLL